MAVAYPMSEKCRFCLGMRILDLFAPSTLTGVLVPTGLIL